MTRLFLRAFLVAALGLTNVLYAQQPASRMIVKATSSNPAEDERIEAILGSKGSLTEAETSLHGVTSNLRDLKIHYVLDEPALIREGLDPLLLRFQPTSAEVSLGESLRAILNQHELDYVVRGGRIFISTQFEISDQILVKVYQVDDLVGSSLANGRAFQPLIDVITASIQPYSWENVGGLGTITQFQHSLVIGQTGKGHQRIENLLEALRRTQRDPTSKTARKQDWAESPLTIELLNHIQADATNRRSFQFNNQPLANCVQALSQEFGLPLFIDWRALDNTSLNPSTLVRADLMNVSIHEALEQLTRGLNAGFAIDHESLEVTSADDARVTLLVAAYPVVDLVSTSSGSEVHLPLIDTITTSVKPTSWESVGGQGTIKVYARASCLVISQTYQNHLLVGQLLAALRKAAPAKTNQTAPQPLQEELVTRVYSLSSDAAAVGFERYLRDIRPRWWESGEASLNASGRQVIVKQTKDAHRQIDRLLQTGPLETVRPSNGMGMF